MTKKPKHSKLNVPLVEEFGTVGSGHGAGGGRGGGGGGGRVRAILLKRPNEPACQTEISCL